MLRKNYYFHSDGVHQSTFDRLVYLMQGMGSSVTTYNLMGEYCAIHSVDSAPYWVIGFSYFSENNTKLVWSLSHPQEYEWELELFIRVNVDELIERLEYYLEEVVNPTGEDFRGMIQGEAPFFLDDNEISNLKSWTKTILNIPNKGGSDNTDKENQTMADNNEPKPTVKKLINKEDLNPPQFQFSQEVQPFILDMKLAAREGRYGKVIGRDQELQQLSKTLSRHKKANALLVGESGVGKSSVIEYLAQELLEQTPAVKHIQNLDLYSISVGEIVAGCKYVGMLEERVTNIFKEFSKKGNCIIFIDEIHQVLNKTGESTPKIANLMKAHLTGKDIKVIGATTYKESKILEKDPAFLRRFQKLDILEPDQEDTFQILKGLRRDYQGSHNVRYSDNSLKYIISLSSDYIQHQHQPDLSINVLDLVGVECKFEGKKVITRSMIEKVISNLTLIPVDKIGHSSDHLVALEDTLNKQIFGQEQPLKVLSDLVKIGMSGLKEKNKPIANLLFTGPTGVGKSESVKVLAEVMGCNILKLDMSEYSDKTSTNKLIGSGAGYVGYEDGGILTRWLEKNSNGIILLDEIEKADGSVYNLLLQMLDDGVVTDNQGKVIKCSNHIIIMTSNVGSRVSNEVKSGIGFMSNTQEEKAVEVRGEVLKDYFAPEFLARLDNVCEFNPLNDEVAKMIINKFVREIEDRSGVSIKLTEGAVEVLLDEGFDEKMGARPLKTILKRTITTELADIIISGGEVKEVVVDSWEEGIVVSSITELAY